MWSTLQGQTGVQRAHDCVERQSECGSGVELMWAGRVCVVFPWGECRGVRPLLCTVPDKKKEDLELTEGSLGQPCFRWLQTQGAGGG